MLRGCDQRMRGTCANRAAWKPHLRVAPRPGDLAGTPLWQTRQMRQGFGNDALRGALPVATLLRPDQLSQLHPAPPMRNLHAARHLVGIPLVHAQRCPRCQLSTDDPKQAEFWLCKLRLSAIHSHSGMSEGFQLRSASLCCFIISEIFARA